MRTRLGSIVIVATALAVVVAARGVAEPARVASFGANDDTALFLPDGGVRYFAQMASLGLEQVVLTLRFTPSAPARIEQADRIDVVVRNAIAAGVHVVFAVYPYPPRELQAGAGSPQAFASWLTSVATRYPEVRQFTVMNEPNQTAFLRPQFRRDRTNISAVTTGSYLAAAYDALKAVDPSIQVIGVGLSPRGNDDARAPSNVSTSPVRFLEALGRWYRASGRVAPLMDGFSFHPYPVRATDPLAKPYVWPNAGFSNLDRIKQALWDAFAGTRQPTTVNGLKLYLDEVGWQVDTRGLPGYTGRENVAVTDEASQAAIYGQLVRAAICDPDIAAVDFFGFYDDRRREGFQAGLYRADGTPRSSATAVQGALADAASSGCARPHPAWSPESGVVGAATRPPSSPIAAVNGSTQPVSVAVDVAEGARVTAMLRPVAGGGSALERLLAPADAVDLPTASTSIPFGHGTLSLSIPAGLASGVYRVVVRFVAEANASRASVLDGPTILIHRRP